MSHMPWQTGQGGILGGGLRAAFFSTNGYCSIQTFGPRPSAMPYFFANSIATGRNTIQQLVNTSVTVTYSASMTINASQGNSFIITATNATAFTINAPTNGRAGQIISVTIRNTSGGALGAATWNAVFKLSAWVNPATAFSRSIQFRYDGTNWIERSRTPADVPN
jgi:hypothetical protein